MPEIISNDANQLIYNWQDICVDITNKWGAQTLHSTQMHKSVGINYKTLASSKFEHIFSV